MGAATTKAGPREPESDARRIFSGDFQLPRWEWPEGAATRAKMGSQTSPECVGTPFANTNETGRGWPIRAQRGLTLPARTRMTPCMGTLCQAMPRSPT